MDTNNKIHWSIETELLNLQSAYYRNRVFYFNRINLKFGSAVTRVLSCRHDTINGVLWNFLVTESRYEYILLISMNVHSQTQDSFRKWYVGYPSAYLENLMGYISNRFSFSIFQKHLLNYDNIFLWTHNHFHKNLLI